MSYPRERDKMHWFAQLIMNCAISAVCGGVCAALGANFWLVFFICLAACYGVWFFFIMDNDGGDTGLI